MKVRIAVPNKGRLREPTLNLLRKAGLRGEYSGRLLYSQTSNPNIELIFARAMDIPGFVALGAADLGVTGHDYVVEAGVEVLELLDLGYGRARIVVAAPEDSVDSLRDVKPGSVVATKYINIARRFFESIGLEVSILRISGAAEVTPYLGIADLIVDVTSTGSTLAMHRLRILTEVMDTSARLIANPSSFKSKRELVEEVRLALDSVIRAEGMKLIMMNVPDDKLSSVLAVLPAMAGPTIAEVKAEVKMWEVYTVVSENDLYRVINEAKKAGGRDIVVLPIERVV
ncbi:MAG: ATP phosphoribosyltransferase, partial [Candidatus Bathyarchaeota archaeon]|nr:ATP phosphoribosyltransferase [Candidatus Bathyarchaeota archaeon]